jgi:hypothetical protein
VESEVPSQLIAGDLWQWTRELSDYPAGTWTLTYYFSNKDQSFSVAGTPAGVVHGFSIAAATTAGYKAGRYKYSGRVVNGASSFTIEEGWLEVAANPAASGNRDVRSFARRTLDAIEATLEGRATSDQLAMSVNGRSISRIPLEELIAWRDRLRNIRIRFGRP